MSRRVSLGDIEIDQEWGAGDEGDDSSSSSIEILSVPGELEEQEEEEAFYAAQEAAGEDEAAAFGGPLIRADEIELVEKLGEGHFGEVYEGYCRQQKVAVKVPRSRLTEEQVAEFKLEMVAMTKLVHPNLVALLGAFFPSTKEEEELGVMIVMEFFGSDLEQMIFSQRPLLLARRMGWARQVALGMCWLHGAGYVHLDLKPANLLLQRSTDTVKIADFGLAIWVGTGGYLNNTAKGTPVYAAPELYIENRVAPQCDVYSFGICLYEFIMRDMAYNGTTLPDTMEDFFEMVCEGVRPWNDEVPVPRDLPHSLVSLVRACWRADPVDRPNFELVLRSMPRVLVDCAVPESHAPMRDFWLSMCMEGELTEQINLARFTRYFLRNINAQDGALAFAEPLIRQLFSTKVNGESVVEYEHFGRVLGFLPAMQEDTFNRDWFLDVAALCQKEWFWGDVTSTEAQKKLLGISKRRFIIRFSSASPHYTVSIRSEKNVAHRRLLRSVNNPQVMLEKPLAPNVRQTKFSSLDELVKVMVGVLNITPLPNGPFEWCFANADPYGMTGYAGNGYDADV